MGLILSFGGAFILLIMIFVGYYLIQYPEKIIKNIKVSILRMNYKKIKLKIVSHSIVFFMFFLCNKSTVIVNYIADDISNNNTEFTTSFDKLNEVFISLIKAIYIFVTVFYIPLIIYYITLFLIKFYMRRKRYKRIKEKSI